MSLRFCANPSFREGLLFISDMIYNVVMNKKDNKTKRNLSDIDNELKSIKLEITKLKVVLNEKADKEKLLELERRVISLEKELATLR